MFGYFTDLEICLVSEKNLKSELLLIFNFRNPSFSSYRFRLGGLGRSGLGRCVLYCFWTTLGVGGGCNSIAGVYSKSGRFYALESHQRIEKLWPRA